MQRWGLVLVVGGLALTALLGSSACHPASAPVVTLGDALDFPGATGWTPTECAAAEACAGAWRHESGQQVSVLVVPVPEPQRLAELAGRLQASVVQQGGLVEVHDAGGGSIVRLLQPVDVDGAASVTISYVLAAPDRRALHIVTSTTSLATQVAADERVRDLLAFAAWVQAEAKTSG